MCNIYEDLDKMVGLFSMDWGYLGQTLTNTTIYIAYEAKDLLLDIANNMGSSCQDEALIAAEQAVQEGIINDIDEFIVFGEDEDGNFTVDEGFDVDRLTDVLKEAGESMLDCIVKDINLYEIGLDLGTIMSRVLQAQLDPTN